MKGRGRTARKVSKANRQKESHKSKTRDLVSAQWTKVGTVTHYFPQVRAAAIFVENGEVRPGDELHFRGHTTDFKYKVKSLQINRKPVEMGSKGDEIGILVKSRARAGDGVYKRL